MMDKDVVALATEGGCCVHQGGKSYQEDRCVFIEDLNKYIENDRGDIRRSYYAIFDGHGGYIVSDFLAKQFHLRLCAAPKIKYAPMNELQQVWRDMDELVFNELMRLKRKDVNSILPRCGSTGTVCLIVGNDIYIANCGDSAAMVVYSNGEYAQCTEEHGTANAEECDRVLASGAKLVHPTPLEHCQPMFNCPCFKPIPPAEVKKRVYPGGLLVTRSFGDFYAKKPAFGGVPNSIIHDHGKLYYKSLLDTGGLGAHTDTNENKSWIESMLPSDMHSAAPTHIQFVVLASDGIWDVLTKSEIAKYVRTRLNAFKHGAALPKPTLCGTPEVASNVMDRTRHNVHTKPKSSFGVNATRVTPDVTGVENVVGYNHDQPFEMTYCNAIAKELVEMAVNSPKWREFGCSADNTSCIVISIAAPPNVNNSASPPHSMMEAMS